MCRVVKILLSRGIRGAEAQKVWPLGFIQNGPAPQSSILPGSTLTGNPPYSSALDPLVYKDGLVPQTNNETENKAFFFILSSFGALIQLYFLQGTPTLTIIIPSLL